LRHPPTATKTIWLRARRRSDMSPVGSEQRRTTRRNDSAQTTSRSAESQQEKQRGRESFLTAQGQLPLPTPFLHHSAQPARTKQAAPRYSLYSCRGHLSSLDRISEITEGGNYTRGDKHRRARMRRSNKDFRPIFRPPRTYLAVSQVSSSRKS
jgi:hypothetical protein